MPNPNNNPENFVNCKYFNNNPENFVNCKYYDIGQVKNLKTCDDNKSLSLFHLNICSLSKNFADFQLLIYINKY